MLVNKSTYLEIYVEQRLPQTMIFPFIKAPPTEHLGLSICGSGIREPLSDDTSLNQVTPRRNASFKNYLKLEYFFL